VTAPNVKVQNISSTDVSSNFNFDVPTNPIIRAGSTFTTSHRLFTVIHTDHDTSKEVTFDKIVSGATDIFVEYENLETTPGYRIQSFDIHNQGFGIDLAGISTSHHNFVLLHSDDGNLHHFAKITEVNLETSEGSAHAVSFEFEPKLGKEIQKGTKYMLFKGPSTTNNVVALSAGIKAQRTVSASTIEVQDSLSVSRPLFYFFDDKLDKKRQLDHNTKYLLRMESASSGTNIEVDAQLSVFVTTTDYQKKIIDYGPHSLRVTLTDVLRDKDAPSVNTPQEYNSGVSQPTLSYIDYNAIFYNARREVDDESTGTLTYDGPKRYLHYSLSPDYCNNIPNLYAAKITDALGDKAGLTESAAIDNFRILDKKISENEPLRIRQSVYREDINGWVSTGLRLGAYNALSNFIRYFFDNEIGRDDTDFLNQGEEVLIGDRVLIYDGPQSGQLVFLEVSRLETDLEFTSTVSLTGLEDELVYRRAYCAQTNKLHTDYNIVSNRFQDLFIKFTTKNLSYVYSAISNASQRNKTLTLSFDGVGYGGDQIGYLEGFYEIFVERFTGQIEELKTSKTQGLNIMEISGRNDLYKLINPIVNKKNLFSEDMIYSTNSFFPKLVGVNASAVTATVSASSNPDRITSVSATPTVFNGDKIYGQYSNGVKVFIGRAERSDSSNIYLTDTARATGSFTNIYRERTQAYILNKALASNYLSTDSTTALEGSAQKGVIFNSGTGLSLDGKEVLNLSEVTNTETEKGRAIFSPTNIRDDKKFELFLESSEKFILSCTFVNGSSLVTTSSTSNIKNGFKMFAYGSTIIPSNTFVQSIISSTQFIMSNSATASGTLSETEFDPSFETVNTLSDFTVLGIKEENEGASIELAPYVPITLARVTNNKANAISTSYTSTIATVTGKDGRALIVSSVPSKATLKKYEPYYVDGEFIGLFVGTQTLHNGSAYEIKMFFDRPQTVTSGDLKRIDAQTSFDSKHLSFSLSLLNGEHLHGGKAIGLLHPIRIGANAGSLSRPALFNSVFDYASPALSFPTYAQKFGSPVYRIYNLEKGQIDEIDSKRTDLADSNDLHFYQEKLSNVNYYADAHKPVIGFTQSTTTTDDVYGTDRTGTGKENQLLIESLGYQPPRGSKFNDREFGFTGESAPVYQIRHYDKVGSRTNLQTEETSPNRIADILEQIDSKIARMFLFVNCDAEAYWGQREDSLFNSTNAKNIENYSLTLIKQPKLLNQSIGKSNLSGESQAISNTDSDYFTVAITSGNKTPSSLKQFGLMRLTECIYDWHFNQFDPENPPSLDRSLPRLRIPTGKIVATSISASSYSGKVITASANPSSDFFAGDYVCNASGEVIGEVASTSSTQITLVNEPAKVSDSSGLYTGVLSVITLPEDSTLSGNATEDTSLHGNLIHMNKGAIVDADDYGESGSAFHTRHSETFRNMLLQKASESNNEARRPSIVHPIDLGRKASFVEVTGTTTSGNSNVTSVSAQDIKVVGAGEYVQVSAIPHGTVVDTVSSTAFSLEDENTSPSAVNATANGARAINVTRDSQQFSETIRELANGEDNSAVYQKAMGLVLDTFTLESGFNDVKKGLVTGFISNTARVIDADTNTISLTTRSSDDTNDRRFEQFKDHDETANATASHGGALLGFKLRLEVTSGMVTGVDTLNTIGGNLYSYDITSVANSPFGKVNLTGCYLISEAGLAYDSVTKAYATYNGQNGTPPSINNSRPTDIAYVMSHELDPNAGTELFKLVTDHALSQGFYRIMQPNHTCLHSNVKRKIPMNVVTSNLTLDNTGTPYDKPPSFLLKNMSAGNVLEPTSTKNAGGSEAALSMLVAIDLNRNSDSHHYNVIRDYDVLDDVIPTSETIMCISDGQSPYKTSVILESSGLGYVLNLGETRKIIGAASVTEPFTVKTNYKVDSDYKRALIGTSVSVGPEVDEIVEDLLNEENIQFSLSSSTKQFVTPTLQGVSLLSAVNSLLKEKNQTLHREGETLKIVDRDSSETSPDILISDNGDYLITSYEKDKTVFDKYNSIVVFGRANKAQKRNVSDIKKNGTKTLEVVDRSLLTQREVESKAKELFILHNKVNEKLVIELAPKSTTQFKPGDIVQVEIRRENIPRAEYYIIEIEYNLTGKIKLVLGKFSKNIGDRFAELLVQNRKTNVFLREEISDSTVVNLDFVRNIKVKPLKLLVRKADLAGFKFGFTSTLGFSTTFLSGVNTITDLVEVDY